MFLEALVELLFLCNSEEYTENVPGTSFTEYPKYSYTSHKPGPNPRFPESASLSLQKLSQQAPFIFKGDPGRPRTSIPAKITPISQHQHIKTTIRGYCLVCRISIEVKTKNSLGGSKRIRGTKTLWKCSEYAVSICRPGEPCWNIAHRRLFDR